MLDRVQHTYTRNYRLTRSQPHAIYSKVSRLHFSNFARHNDYHDIAAIQNDTHEFLNEKIWFEGWLIDGVKFRRI